MATTSAPATEDHGKTLVSWTFPEVPNYQYSRTWYLVMVGVAIGLLTFAVFTSNPLFAFIVIIAWALIFYRSRQKPKVLKASITEDGIEVGKNFFPFDDLRSFWLVYKPPAKTLYMNFKSALRPILGVNLEDANPVEIRNQLRRYLQEDLSKEDESTSDAIGRLFRI